MESNKKIVFVDDDENNVLLVEVWLTNFGFKNIVCYQSPEKALEDLERGGEKPAMFIADYSMPTMTGVDLLDSVKKKYPEIKTLIVSATSQLQWHPDQPHKVLVKGGDYLDDLVRVITTELAQ